MRPKTLIVLLISLSAFVLSGATCSRVYIQDHEICGDKGELGAHCNRLSSNRPRDPGYYQWEEERFGQMCMKADAWAEIIGAVLKLCDQTNRCTWQEMQKVQTLGRRVIKFKKEVARIRR